MSHRTQITLTDEQYARLQSESERSGLGLAELVRRALDRSYGKDANHALRGALDESFGAWGEGANGKDYVESMRSGMAKRLAHS